MYKHINDHERDLIANWHAEGVSNREIAKRLKRNTSTIGRELVRNSFKGTCYIAIHAAKKANNKQQEAKRRHPINYPAAS